MQDNPNHRFAYLKQEGRCGKLESYKAKYVLH